MKRWQQLLSCFLALCVFFAGAVGISPVLHVWVEHGGQGLAHTHLGAVGIAHSEGHAHPHPHGVVDVPLAPSPQPSGWLVDTSKPLTFFGLRPLDIYRAVGRLVARAVEHVPATPAKGETGHTHHSLAQMLISGLVEGACDVPALVRSPAPITFAAVIPETILRAADWDAQTAGRAPPRLS